MPGLTVLPQQPGKKHVENASGSLLEDLGSAKLLSFEFVQF